MTEPGGQAGPQMGRPRHRSFVGPILLIVLGCVFLAFTLYPNFDPWPILYRYWPLILILIGLGKIWDSYYAHQHPDRAVGPWISGTGLAWTILLLFFFFAAWHRGSMWHGPWGWHEGRGWNNRAWAADVHDTQAVELQGAKSVRADLEMPAGVLTLAGGSSRLLDADFQYNAYEGKPRVDYIVSGDSGQLSVTQHQDRPHFGNDYNEWNLHFNNGVPVDLRLQMGAGRSDMRLNGMSLSGLDVHMGAGELNLDLTGERKTSFQGDIEGGAGRATIRLPRDVGVRVYASGGISSINATGFRRDAGAYINDAYGKTSTTINLTVHGGVGEIDLIEE
ncbi:MAG: toast rack family protein [Acidobacteriia bacterium]|nr:toast rack family protein [Terriglobia bacterium]